MRNEARAGRIVCSLGQLYQERAKNNWQDLALSAFWWVVSTVEHSDRYLLSSCRTHHIQLSLAYLKLILLAEQFNAQIEHLSTTLVLLDEIIGLRLDTFVHHESSNNGSKRFSSTTYEKS